MKKSRDDFLKSTKEALAQRVGYICSYPGCGQLTIGPSNESPSSTSSIGMACHISGAASGSGSRRYDCNLTQEERSNISNGIWMCNNHGTKIDRDEDRYSLKVLKRFKEIAEEIASIMEDSHYDYKKALKNVDVKDIQEFILDPDKNDILIFDFLSNILRNPNRHPNYNDLIKGIYYRDDTNHHIINNSLQTKRMALILGNPGSGKTSLARAIGFEYLINKIENYNVLFADVHSDIEYQEFLSEITKHDYSQNLFIIDNCQNAIEQINELVSRLDQVKAAQLLFISRIFDPSLAGPRENNFLDLLINDTIELNVNESVLNKIINVYVETKEINSNEIGDVSLILEKTGGTYIYLIYIYSLGNNPMENMQILVK